MHVDFLKFYKQKTTQLIVVPVEVTLFLVQFYYYNEVKTRKNELNKVKRGIPAQINT